MPPMNISVIDHRNFGRKPTVGISVLKTMEEFRCDPLAPPADDDVQGELICWSGIDVWVGGVVRNHWGAVTPYQVWSVAGLNS